MVYNLKSGILFLMSSFANKKNIKYNAGIQQ
jgi:hypothetical protein